MTIRVTRLPSGLRVATDSFDTVETVTLGSWIGIGTRHEPAEINGVAHLLEHMAFKGTERRSAQQIAEEIEAVGGQLNAYTGRENTAFYAKVLAEDSALALDIIADILQHARFDPEELARERAVVLQEIGQANDTPDDIIFDHFQETAYPGQALGRPVLGRPEVVAGPRATVFAATWPTSTGPTTWSWPRPAGSVTRPSSNWSPAPSNNSPAKASPAGSRRAMTAAAIARQRELEQVHLVLGLEAPGYLSPAYYGLLVLSTLFGGGMSSRLFQEVRERRGLVYSIYSFVSAFRDGGLFGIYAGTGETEAAELVPVVCDELGRLGHDIEPAEIDRAKAQLRASILMSRESTGARCEQLAQQILTYDRPIESSEILEKVARVDLDQLRTLAGGLLEGQPTFAALGPIGSVEEVDKLAARLN